MKVYWSVANFYCCDVKQYSLDVNLYGNDVKVYSSTNISKTNNQTHHKEKNTCTQTIELSYNLERKQQEDLDFKPTTTDLANRLMEKWFCIWEYIWQIQK